MIVSLNTIFYYCINWCSGERTYEPSMFHNRVERIPIDDHNVPRLRLESDLSPVVTLSLSLPSGVWCVMERRKAWERSLPHFPPFHHTSRTTRERERERRLWTRKSSSLLSSQHPCSCRACCARRPGLEYYYYCSYVVCIFSSNFKWHWIQSRQTANYSSC